MSALMIIICFIIALIIYFGKYHEEDKKALSRRSKQHNRNRDGDYFIFPFLEERRGGDPEETPDSDGSDYEELHDDDPDFDG